MVETQGIPRGRLFLRTSLLHIAGSPGALGRTCHRIRGVQLLALLDILDLHGKLAMRIQEFSRWLWDM